MDRKGIPAGKTICENPNAFPSDVFAAKRKTAEMESAMYLFFKR